MRTLDLKETGKIKAADKADAFRKDTADVEVHSERESVFRRIKNKVEGTLFAVVLATTLCTATVGCGKENAPARDSDAFTLPDTEQVDAGTPEAEQKQDSDMIATDKPELDDAEDEADVISDVSDTDVFTEVQPDVLDTDFEGENTESVADEFEAEVDVDVEMPDEDIVPPITHKNCWIDMSEGVESLYSTEVITDAYTQSGSLFEVYMRPVLCEGGYSPTSVGLPLYMKSRFNYICNPDDPCFEWPPVFSYSPPHGIKIKWLGDGYTMHIAADDGYGVYENGGSYIQDLFEGYITWMGYDSNSNPQMSIIRCTIKDLLVGNNESVDLYDQSATTQMFTVGIYNSPPYSISNPEDFSAYIEFPFKPPFVGHHHIQVYDGALENSNLFQLAGYDSVNKFNFDYTVYSGGYEEAAGKYRFCVSHTNVYREVVTLYNDDMEYWYGLWGGYGKKVLIQRSYTKEGNKITGMSINLVYSPWNEGW